MSDDEFHTGFSVEILEKFQAEKRPGPIHMLNLVRLRVDADYPDGRVSTGVEAYKTYGTMTAPLFEKLGGKIIWRGRPELTVIGPSDEAWDIAFIAQYPGVQAFLDLMTDPDYQTALVHRQAAVLDSRLIRFGTDHG